MTKKEIIERNMALADLGFVINNAVLNEFNDDDEIPEMLEKGTCSSIRAFTVPKEALDYLSSDFDGKVRPIIYTIYDHPKDYPDKYVLRRWLCDKLPPVFDERFIFLSDSLDTIREFLAFDLHLINLHRGENDDPAIIESWM